MKFKPFLIIFVNQKLLRDLATSAEKLISAVLFPIHISLVCRWEVVQGA